MIGDWDSETDVLVVGAGGCGLVAALAAAEAGVETAIVEKSDRRGANNTALSTGSIIGAGSRFQREAGIEDSPELLLRNLVRQSAPHEAMPLAKRLAAQSAPLVEWLVDAIGVDLRIITDYKHVGHSVPRLHAPPSRRGQDLSTDLLRAVDERSIPLALSSPVRRLLVEDGHVLGVEVGGGRAGEMRVRARKVILATNGFAANPAMLRRFCPDIAGAPYFGGLGSTGEAIAWGEELGAILGNIGAYQGYATLVYPEGSLLSWTAMEMGGVVVNIHGARFGDESVGYSGFASDVLRQGDFCYALFDARIREYAAAHEQEFRALVEAGALREHASIEEVASAWSLDPERLARTVERYNAAARGQQPDAYARAEFGLAPLHAPFVSTQVQAGLFHTQGGLQVDEDGRVRTGTGIIDNLFAGGGAAAGISGVRGGRGYSSGAGLLAATGLGRLAGMAAAREVQVAKRAARR